WGPLICMGIRPVLTWKSTAAAPTPISEGASSRPSADGPWQVAQFAWNRARPAAMTSSSGASAPTEDGARAADSPPVTSMASSRRTSGASRWFLRAAMAFTGRTSSRWCGKLGDRSSDQVDRAEQCDPDDVDEVPVVGDDDRGGRLVVTEPARGERAAQQEQEGDQSADDVQGVEAGGQVEDRAVRRRGDRHAVRDELGVLEHLAGD